MMSLSMLMAQPGALRQTEEEAGAISTVIIQMDRGAGGLHGGLVIACIVAVATACWLVLRFAEPVGRWIGPVGLGVLVRLFGLVLAAIAVEFIANGLKLLFPALSR